jgi:hypothetical protein
MLNIILPQCYIKVLHRLYEFSKIAVLHTPFVNCGLHIVKSISRHVEVFKKNLSAFANKS